MYLFNLISENLAYLYKPRTLSALDSQPIISQGTESLLAKNIYERSETENVVSGKWKESNEVKRADGK